MSLLQRLREVRPGKGGPEEGRDGRGLVLVLILSGLCLAALGLVLIWLNLQRTQMSYELRVLKAQVEDLTEFTAKLEVERAHLLSRLGERARDMGLAPAKPGQTRRMEKITGTSTTD